jgi:hypothetical protein
MNKYNHKDFTFGVELEYADVNRFNKLPEGAMWNTKDYSIVNSNGIANDPTGELYAFGGEINTKPTNTIEEQVAHIQEINDMLVPKPVINYKCNLHIHIRVPGLKDDLEALKKVMKYIHDFGQQAFELVDPIRLPTNQQYPLPEELKAAKKRNKIGSHHGIVEEEKYNRIMNSLSPIGFYHAHANRTNNDKLIFPKRTGINMRQLFDAPVDTIEFRHFFGTVDMLEMKSCLTWCSEFLNAAINTGETPNNIIKRNPWMKFPKEMNFDLKLHEGFEKTCHDVPKEQRIINIDDIIKQKDLYGTFTEKEVSDMLSEYKQKKRKSLFE